MRIRSALRSGSPTTRPARAWAATPSSGLEDGNIIVDPAEDFSAASAAREPFQYLLNSCTPPSGYVTDATWS